MARPTRSQDWGFPRWRGYGSAREAKPVRLCDRHGCEQPGDCPAPKSPNNPDRWYFCRDHAAEYNKGWDYFAGLDAEEAEVESRPGRRDRRVDRENIEAQMVMEPSVAGSPNSG